MNVFSIYCRPTIGLVGARMHRNVGPTDGLKHAAGILGRTVEGNVSVNSADSQQFQERMVGGQEDCKGILDTVNA